MSPGKAIRKHSVGVVPMRSTVGSRRWPMPQKRCGPLPPMRAGIEPLARKMYRSKRRTRSSRAESAWSFAARLFPHGMPIRRCLPALRLAIQSSSNHILLPSYPWRLLCANAVRCWRTMAAIQTLSRWLSTRSMRPSRSASSTTRQYRLSISPAARVMADISSAP